MVLSVDITSDTRQFQAQVDDVSNQLAKVKEQLDQTTASGDKAGGSIESSMHQAQQASAESTTVFRQQTTAVKQGTQEQTEAFGVSQREINSIQKEGLRTTGAALAQTVAQSASAIDGSVNGALNALSNISIGITALSSVPEVAAAAGVIALITAAITGAVQKSQAEIQLEQQDVSDLVKEMEKLGVSGPSSVASINAALKTFSTTTDGSDKDLDALRKTADQAGISWIAYARAVAGSTKDQEDLYNSVNKQIEVLDAQSRAVDTTTNSGTKSYGVLQKRLAALQAVSDELEKQNKDLGLSKTRVDEYSQAQQTAITKTHQLADATKAFGDIGSNLASEQQQNAQDLTDAQSKLATAVENSNGRQTKAVKAARAAEVAASQKADVDTTANFIAAQKKEIDALLTANQSKAEIYSKFGNAAGKAIIKDVGDNPTLLEALAGASPAQVTTILGQYAAAGTAAGATLVHSAQSGANSVGPIKVPVVADTTSIDRTLTELKNRQITVKINSQFGRSFT